MANILIIDDSTLIREVLQTMVALFDHTSVVASSGQQALDILDTQGEAIEIIFLDWYLTDMRGDAFLQTVHNDARWADIPIVLVTGSMLRDIMNAIHTYQVPGYISKPFHIEDIERVLLQLVG